ncbi:MAG TPA: hypothetical protein DD435_00325 [Cyanobacteria bacterium UBA8530]|nr:hypothetical protein [Cyanobacteria bacterium UBA8530]
MLLIVGANGLLGRHAGNYFMEAGRSVISVSHGEPADFQLDLRFPVEGDFLKEKIPARVKAALICSAVTSLDECFLHKEETRRFNVTHTIALLQWLIRHHVLPIFCSSDQVFAGEKGGYREDDERTPASEYGRQKKAVEDFLEAQDRPYLILRLSKLYSLDDDDTSPIGQMLTTLSQGKIVRGAYDQAICPTLVDDLPRAIAWLLDYGATGAFHLAALRRYTRHELALQVADSIGREAQVEQCSIRDIAFAEPRTLDNTLVTEKFLARSGFRFRELAETLPTILANRKMIEGAKT